MQDPACQVFIKLETLASILNDSPRLEIPQCAESVRKGFLCRAETEWSPSPFCRASARSEIGRYRMEWDTVRCDFRMRQNEQDSRSEQMSGSGTSLLPELQARPLRSTVESAQGSPARRWKTERRTCRSNPRLRSLTVLRPRPSYHRLLPEPPSSQRSSPDCSSALLSQSSLPPKLTLQGSPWPVSLSLTC